MEINTIAKEKKKEKKKKEKMPRTRRMDVKLPPGARLIEVEYESKKRGFGSKRLPPRNKDTGRFEKEEEASRKMAVPSAAERRSSASRPSRRSSSAPRRAIAAEMAAETMARGEIAAAQQGLDTKGFFALGALGEQMRAFFPPGTSLDQAMQQLYEIGYRIVRHQDKGVDGKVPLLTSSVEDFCKLNVFMTVLFIEMIVLNFADEHAEIREIRDVYEANPVQRIPKLDFCAGTSMSMDGMVRFWNDKWGEWNDVSETLGWTDDIIPIGKKAEHLKYLLENFTTLNVSQDVLDAANAPINTVINEELEKVRFNSPTEDMKVLTFILDQKPIMSSEDQAKAGLVGLSFAAKVLSDPEMAGTPFDLGIPASAIPSASASAGPQDVRPGFWQRVRGLFGGFRDATQVKDPEMFD